ncbi:MAG: 30S ribosome-binding factor RbfA [Gaiella sp.]
MSAGTRMRRVEQSIKHVLSTAIGELKDPRIGFVTVTAVEATQDLEHATVWVSVYGSEREQAQALEALAGAAGVLQARINRALHLRRTPHLRFTYDEAVERGVNMSRLIDDLAAEAPPTPPPADWGA